MKARVIALYLPQFHPIPENDKWWGKGFTEWRNVGLAKPLFKGHYQPKVPSDLGYYDLRVPEVRRLQADLAREAGVEGFCYWHYWFNGKELLERPFREVLESGEPDFPFCLGWANHSWSNKTWTVGKKFRNTMLMEQTYPGKSDYEAHFNAYLNAFKDKRYIKVDGKLFFVVYDPFSIPNVEEFITTWNNLAVSNGLPKFHFAGITSNFLLNSSTEKSGPKLNFRMDMDASHFYNQVLNLGFDAVISRGTVRAEMMARGKYSYLFDKFKKNVFKMDNIMKYEFKDIIKNLYVEQDKWENVYPTIIPGWDRTPRSGKRAVVWHNNTPQLFKEEIENCLNIVRNKDDEHKIVILQSWNEWGEGNYVEPDCKYGKGYLDALHESIIEK